jgi:hypothetical protein
MKKKKNIRMYESSCRKNEWYCKKCKLWLGNHIELDYHENTEHADMSDPFVVSWTKRGRPGLSPYD